MATGVGAAAGALGNALAMRPPLRVTFVTGNAKKLEEVVAILGTQHAARFVVSNVDLDLPELQGEPEAVARAKAVEASKRVRRVISASQSATSD